MYLCRYFIIAWLNSAKGDILRRWETLIEMAIQEAVNAGALGEEDLSETTEALADAAALTVTTEATDRCLTSSAVTAAKTLRYLLDHQGINRYIAVSVLKKWEEGITTEDRLTGRDRATEVLPMTNTKLNWSLLTQSWTEY